MSNNGTGNVQDELNRCMPAAAHGKLGDVLNDLLTAYNDLAAKHNALLAKLDADAGVADTNYAATQSASYTSLKTLAQRNT
jgi:hypothetical protein